MHDCFENVNFYANPITEYISRRICCQRFYEAPRLRDQDRTATWRIFGGPKASRAVWPARSGWLEVETTRSSFLFSEVADQMLSDEGGSENQMIADMQVINFLTREFRCIYRG